MDKMKECEDLVETLEKETQAVLKEGPVLQVTEQYEFAKKYLSEASQKAMEKRSKTTIYLDDSGTYYTCIFLAVTVPTSNIETGVRKICENINTLSLNGLVHSCLAMPSSIDLASMPNEVPTSAVIGYVHVPASQKARAELLVEYSIDSNSTPKAIEDLEIKRPPGEFFTLLRFTHTFPLGDELEGHEGMVEKKVQECLTMLPHGTEVVSVTKCSITDLSIPYVVTFFNPLMKDYKEVSFDYERVAVCIDDSVKCFSLLKSVHYVKR